jgi:cytoskeletal protein CcmA (bactofilin family)
MFLGLAVSVGAVIGIAGVTQAQWSDNIQGGDSVSVKSGQVHKGSLYATGDQVTIEGTVEGDLYCAGRELIIRGEVTGDVVCAAQSATLEGMVGQDVRLAAQLATLAGKVEGSMTFFGQDLKVQSDGSIGGDLNGAVQFVTLGGPVSKDVLIGAQRLTLNSTVGGDINAALSQVVTGASAKVSGDFNYIADREIRVDESVVDGSVHFTRTEKGNKNTGSMWAFMGLMSLMMTSLVIILLAPRFAERSHQIANGKPLTVGLVGFAVLFGSPMLAVLLIVTVFFAPLGLLVFALWFAAILASQAFFAYLLGSLFWRQQNNMFVRALAGVIVLFALYLIPGINVITGFTSLIGGIGMATTTLLDGYRKPSYTLGSSASKSRAKSKKS